MKVMRHCRQCRADAVGLLGEDRGAEFTMDKLENKEIDYEIAMEKRAVVHEAIERQRTKQRPTRLINGFPKPELTPLRHKTATYAPVRMAVATRGEDIVNEHFGQAREFLIYEAACDGVRFLGYRKTDLYCSGPDSCGDGATALRNTIRTLQGCKVVLCAKIGFEPWNELEAAGILPNAEHAMQPIEEAVMEVYRELIEKGALSPRNALYKGII
jgi:nitrogen fixation protein NifB